MLDDSHLLRGFGPVLLTLALVAAGCQSQAPAAPPTEVPTEARPEPTEAAPTAQVAEAVVPSVMVGDQEISEGAVTVDAVVAAEPGWLVIHADEDGTPGPVIGHGQIAPVEHQSVVVEIEAEAATERLYAMLHVDSGEVGVYEFPGTDPPVESQGGIVVRGFQVQLPTASAQPAHLALAETHWGSVLVDAEGFALYAFTQDSPGQSSCTGGCAEFWPPAVVEGQPTAGEGLEADFLSTLVRPDGSSQLTYNGRPLYRYQADDGPGITQGQAVNGSWYLVDRDGELVREPQLEPAEGGIYDY